ncbi:hypothetical protein W97_07326 [Coniosporium apollinis CBS 100218]|uniref:Glycosyltransferase 2-like domain-containing protein n=1 Tax=Coniosporium apollinis (strain CBS 100218) TaxID=1168221 RepID=R7Z1Z9_CONA1|nr:uncharacterized protein W97_07326 [Coniosporium apollinis CBS 100218]EON68177.1 hypothetical protein W97_07326 [Coniosporium apollinis CBS 100218]
MLPTPERAFQLSYDEIEESLPTTAVNSPVYGPSRRGSDSKLSYGPQAPPTIYTPTLSPTRTNSLRGRTACASPNDLMEQDEIVKEKVLVAESELPFNGLSTGNAFGRKYYDAAYMVEKIHEHDDGDRLPHWKKVLNRFGPLATALAMASYFLYFGFRIYYTLAAQREYHKVYVMAWLFIAAEAALAVPAALHNTYALLAVKGRRRPKLRLRGDIAPTVDVFITCCKEDVDVVLDTVRAACAVDYPQDRFRVVVCDDGADQELKKAVLDLSDDYPNLFYHARVKVKGVPHHYKAGNLIGGTGFVTTLRAGPAEYIAALDADMIPEPEWLRAIMAHMVIDPRMSLVCPPQLFYNVPESDPLVQSLDAFVHVMEPTKDACGVAWCTGSGYAVRRAALDAIGGWPTGSLAEDVCTSSMLLGAGWRTAFVHEALQFGTVPETFTGHLKQRTRWTLGTLQTAVKLRFCLFGKLTRKMTFFQRLSGFVFTIDAFFKIFSLIALLTIPIVLVSGGQLVAFANYGQLRWQIRLCFASLILTRINEYIMFIPSGYRLAQRDSGAQQWMAPYHALTILTAFILPSWLGGKPMTFSSSGSIKSELNERDARLRAPLWRRLKVMIWDCKVYLHILYIAFVMTSVILSTVRAFFRDSAYKVLVYLLTHAFWPPLIWLLCITAFCVPIRYTIWPPTVPDREELLDRDPKTGIAHPKPEFKIQRWRKATFWHETQYTVITIFTGVIFFGSFFI